MKTAILIGCILILLIVISFIIFKTVETKSSDEVENVSPMVKGYEWGPGTTGLVIKMNSIVTDVNTVDCVVKTDGVKREVVDSYLVDGSGNPCETPTQYIYLTLKITNMKDSGCPLVYDNRSGRNNWTSKYKVSVSDLQVTMDGKTDRYTWVGDCSKSLLRPQYDAFSKRSTFSGTYYNAYIKEDVELSISTAAYEPKHLAGGELNPLIIWLHGAGEGGEDPSVVLYGNQVTALAENPIQSYFQAGNQTGAYVWVAQCPTCWMDEGNGLNSYGSVDSLYIKILMDAIDDYVKNNPDVDTSRIYIGGCSNGGYMTMQMLTHYQEYFAAGFPVCVAYPYYSFQKDASGNFTGSSSTERWLTPEKVDTLKDKPLWFVQAANDLTLKPTTYGLPVYQAILQAGNTNCWYSYFENVLGTDAPGEDYLGHFSWIYALHDQVKGVQDPEKVKNSNASNSYGFVPDNASGGGTYQAKYQNTTYSSMFEWMADQHK